MTPFAVPPSQQEPVFKGIRIRIGNGTNGIDLNPDTERFEGDHATEANALLDEDYRPGHELPIIT